MPSSSIEKPFYLHPPWSILFDFRKLEKLTPWNINIAFLLTTFLEEMEKTNEMDFRASGVALDSSALIYWMKSKLLLKLEEPPPPPKPPKDFLPPALFLPLRHELTSTTIKHLLEALDEALKGGKPILQKEIIQEPVLPDPSDILPNVDLYLMEIEQQMEELYTLLSRKVKGVGIIEFSTLIRDKTRLEAIRTFILLLFLVQDARVNLWQDEETEEIYIAIGEMSIAESREADF
ncbi:MAG: hypothetical protein PVH12_04140 [Candidatus Bathyarchaeota archaeon]|jgi:chromatin segregation and condensation protein Rec8/ScpA/Scc1 (kleisin family)